MTTALARQLPRALITAALAFAGTLASFAVTTAPARAASAGAYAVVLAAPLAAPRREIVDGTIWRCEGDRCTAPADGARSQTVCAKVARKFGPVANFAAPQGTLSDEQITRCNGAS